MAAATKGDSAVSSRQAVDPGKRPELAWLPVKALAVDPKYQRDTASRRSRNLITRIAAGFRWSRFGVVLAARKGKTFFIIDGQHRVEAAREAGFDTVPAVVLPHATVAEAAVDFVAINRDRVAVVPLQIHYAQLAAGEPLALSVDRAARAAGVVICRYNVPASNLKPRQTLAVATIARIVRLKGEDFAARVLRRLVEAAGGDVPGTINAGAIRAAAEELGMSGRNATVMRPQQRRDRVRMRACLGCGKAFRSDGPGNRLCDPCKGRM